VVDPLRVVDVDGEAIRAGELDREHVDVGQALLHRLLDLAV
jgi:hypothetical protein